MESFASNIDSSLRQEHEVALKRIAALEEELARTASALDASLAKTNILQEQLDRAAEALGLSRG